MLLSRCPQLLRALHTSLPHLARSRLVARGAVAALAASAPESVEYLGAQYRNNSWTTTVELGGKRTTLGPFASAKEASDAYVAATAVASTQPASRKRSRAPKGDQAAAAAEGGSQAAAAPQLLQQRSSTYKGVVRDLTPGGAQLYEAVYTTPDGREVSGGEYETEAEAAKAHDALCRMYGGEAEACNFPIDPYTAWVPPEEVVHTGQIAALPGVPLTVEEVLAALQQERGLDVKCVPLAGRSDLADALIFATGRSTVHMRRMADMVARAQRKRALPSESGPVCVEGRDMDDWMVVDCGNLIVNIMDAEARECFDLERMYEGMELGKDPYAGMTYEQWLAANPVPEKWLARLERDEEEMAQAQRVSGKRRGLGYSAAAAGSSSGGGEGGGEGAPVANPNHFSKMLRRGRPGRKTRAAVG